jgi:hypothetical protein
MTTPRDIWQADLLAQQQAIGADLLERVESLPLGDYTERDHALATVHDAVHEMFRDHRLGGEGTALPPGALEDAIRTGLVTVDELSALFRAAVLEYVAERVEDESTVEGIPKP